MAAIEEEEHITVQASIPFHVRNDFVNAFCIAVTAKHGDVSMVRQFCPLAANKVEFLVWTRDQAAALHDMVITVKSPKDKKTYNVTLIAPSCMPPPPPPTDRIRLLNLPLGYDDAEVLHHVKEHLQVNNAVFIPDFVKINKVNTTIRTTSATVRCDVFAPDSRSSRVLHVGAPNNEPVVIIDRRLGDSLSSPTAGAEAFRAARALTKHLDKPDRYRKRPRSDDATPKPAAQPSPTADQPMQAMALPPALDTTSVINDNNIIGNNSTNNNVSIVDSSSGQSSDSDGFTPARQAASRSSSPINTPSSSKKPRTGFADDDMVTSNRFEPLRQDEGDDEILTIAVPVLD